MNLPAHPFLFGFDVILRRLVRTWLILLAAAGCVMAAGAKGIERSATATGRTNRLELGANVNESLDWLVPAMLDQTHTTWVRGFVPASEFITGTRSYETDKGLQSLKAAASSGRKVILSLKWDLVPREANWRVPAPGSPEERKWLEFAERLLAEMRGQVTFLALVNELFIDTQAEDLLPGPDGEIPMVRFMKRLLDRISATKPAGADGQPLPIYVGGFTRLDRERMRKHPATLAMAEWINRDSRLTGATFHLHQPDMASARQALETVRSLIPKKPLVVTEFSLIWKWKANLTTPIGREAAGRAFAERNGLDPSMTVTDFCNRVFREPVQEHVWHEFLKSQSWFEPDYLDVICPLMEQKGVVVATYAFTMDPFWREGERRDIDAPRLSEDSTPWFFNRVLIPGLGRLEGSDTNRVPVNYGFFDSYVRRQLTRR